jgi:integration host factor subunit beta
MNKNKFTRAGIHAVLTAAGMEINQARKLTACIIIALAAVLAAGEVIELRGLGTFEIRKRKARVMRNPRTLAPVKVPARRVIFFKPSVILKRALNAEYKAAPKTEAL